MKKNKIKVSNVIMIVVLPLCSFFINSCDCDENDPSSKCACQYFDLADLLIDSFESVAGSEDSIGTYYDLAHLVLNTVEEIGCPQAECSQGKKAGSNTFKQNIYYNDTYPGSNNVTQWGNPVDFYDFPIGELDGCKTAKTNDNIKFLQDGYYLIEGICDALKIINERDESNNNLQSDPTLKSTPTNVIHINRGLRSNKSLNGETVYIERISSKVTYN